MWQGCHFMAAAMCQLRAGLLLQCLSWQICNQSIHDAIKPWAQLACTGSEPCFPCLLSPWTQSLPYPYLLPPQDLQALPPHDTTSELADAMALAANRAGPAGGLILFVVQPGEINAYDQQVCPLVLCFALLQLLNKMLLRVTD